MIFLPHSFKQELVLFSELRITIAATGIQWGKTQSGALWMKIMMHTYTDPLDNFIITSPSYKIFNQSTLPPFAKFMDGLGVYDKKHDCFRMYNGGTCWFRTGTDPDSVVGITNVRAILCDEAGKYSLYFWENIQGRSSFCKAPVRIVTSPYSLNWLYRDFIKPKRRNPESLPHVELIQATSRENPHFPYEEYEEKRLTMDPRRFNMMYGGEFDKMQGLVYDCFDESLNVTAPFEFPSGTQFFGGIDWGYTEPFVLVVHAVLPNGLRFQVSETYKSGLTLPEIGEICAQKMKTWQVIRFYADPSQPGSIEYLNRLGCTTLAANNDIRVGIDIFYELIKSRTYKIIEKTSPHTLDEFDTYHYPDPKDLRQDQNSKEAKPVGQNDHACLIGNTLIETLEGFKRIDSIAIGETIKTPSGFKRVLDVWNSGEKETFELSSGSGGRIVATADHPFYVPFRGFIPLDAIRYSDIVPTWKKSSLTVRSIIGTANIIALLVALLVAGKGFMLLYGSIILELFQKVSTSITKTMIRQTMRFQTLDFSPSLSILACIQKGYAQKISLKTSIGFDHSLQNGIGATRGENGTGCTRGKHLGNGLNFRGVVNSVRKHLKHFRLGPDFARIIASRVLDVKMGMIIAKERAQSAILFLLPINMPRKKLVREPAQVKPALKQSVYNLTVDGGCFYANGFLVSNCDANRYLIVMTHRSNVKLTPTVPNVKRLVSEEQKIKNLLKLKRNVG